MNSNVLSDDSLFLRALRGEDTDRAPIWLMRQAGRHLAEYRQLKEKHTFWELVRTPELATLVTLQPVRRYGMDAAILFSDIMTPLPALGIEVEFKPGPVLANPIRTAAQVEALHLPEAQVIAPFVSETLRNLREESPVPVIGFAAAPLTLATYAIEGSGSKDYATFRSFLRREPMVAHALLELLTEVTIRYLRMQVDSGAAAVQIFDSWAGLHDGPTFREFGLPYLRRVLQAVQAPGIYMGLNTAHLAEQLAELPVNALSVDWRLPLSYWRGVLPGRTLQGNLDPAQLLAPAASLTAAAQAVLREGLGGPHIFNLGHGVIPTTDPGSVELLVDTVRQFDRRVAFADGMTV